MLEILGTALLWLLALAMMAAYPFTEFARGMATNPDAHERSRGGCLLSLAGVGLAALLLAGCAPAPPVRTTVQEVSVPVAVYPNDPAKVPAMPAPLGPRPSSPSAAADTLLAKVCEWVEFGLVAWPQLLAGSGSRPTAAGVYPECEKKLQRPAR